MTDAVRVLNEYVSHRKDRKNFNDPVTAKEWAELLKDFPNSARYEAANLAAHNWDVAIVGDRLLISSRWGHGKWWDKSAEKSVPLTDNEMSALTKKPKRYEEAPAPDYAALVSLGDSAHGR